MTLRALLLALVVLAPLSAGETPHRTSLEEVIEVKRGWVALRFNFSGPSDIEYEFAWEDCNRAEGQKDPAPPIGGAWFTIVDGKLRSEHMDMGDDVWVPGDDTLALKIGPLRTSAPIIDPIRNCTTKYVSLRGNPGLGELTRVAVGGGEASRLYVFANWSYGVSGYDIAQGQGVVKTKDEFDGVLHANYHPFPASTSVSLLLEERIQHAGDLLGWFYPGGGVQRHSCTMSGSACVPGSLGIYRLMGPGPNDVHVAIDAEASGGRPANALGLALLPSSDYLD